jgi:Ca-activated chloride channel homolog
MNFTDPGNPAVAQLWGRHRIKDLMNQMVQYETKVGVETVTETALTYQLLSQYTAFVALSDDVRVEPGTESISMNVPVEMPEAVEYEGVFGNTRYLKQKRMSPRSAPVARSMQYLADEEYAEIEPDISFSSLAEIRCEASAPSQARRRRTSPVEVVSAAGLDEVARDSLNQHLATLTVPRGINGELVLEIVFGKVRASRIVVDAEASTVADVELLKIIKKWLFSWRIPESNTKKWLFSWRIPHSIENPVRLTLRVRS